MLRLTIVPSNLEEANAFVERHHRHHGKVVGYRFALAVADETSEVHGVAIVGRPVARLLDDGWTLEVTRLATDGTEHAPSKLYAACWRAARAMGYRRLITYILDTEPGTSLKAAGWKLLGEAGGGTWNHKARPRVDRHPTQGKLLWEMTRQSLATFDVPESAIAKYSPGGELDLWGDIELEIPDVESTP